VTSNTSQSPSPPSSITPIPILVNQQPSGEGQIQVHLSPSFTSQEDNSNSDNHQQLSDDHSITTRQGSNESIAELGDPTTPLQQLRYSPDPFLGLSLSPFQIKEDLHFPNSELDLLQREEPSHPITYSQVSRKFPFGLPGDPPASTSNTRRKHLICQFLQHLGKNRNQSLGEPEVGVTCWVIYCKLNT